MQMILKILREIKEIERELTIFHAKIVKDILSQILNRFYRFSWSNNCS